MERQLCVRDTGIGRKIDCKGDKTTNETVEMCAMYTQIRSDLVSYHLACGNYRTLYGIHTSLRYSKLKI